MSKLYCIGKISGTHGLKGELKLSPYYSKLDFSTINNILVNQQSYKILGFRYHKNNILLTLEGISHIDQTNGFIHQEAYIDTPLEEQIFNEDLLSKEVYNKQGVLLGRVSGVLKTPVHDVLEISGEKEILIPMIDKFILEISDKITVDLTDLTEA